jgi:hypothetical protein
MGRIIVALGGLLAATGAFAGTSTVPEPGTFELLALGGVVAVVVAIRNRRK